MESKRCVSCGMEYPNHKMSCKDSVKEYRLPTAEEFYLKTMFPVSFENKHDEVKLWFETAENAKESVNTMIEFAKLHVEAALKEASEKAIVNVFPTDEEQWEHVPEIITSEDLEDNEGIYLIVDKDSILNSYPLDKIK